MANNKDRSYVVLWQTLDNLLTCTSAQYARGSWGRSLRQAHILADRLINPHRYGESQDTNVYAESECKSMQDIKRDSITRALTVLVDELTASPRRGEWSGTMRLAHSNAQETLRGSTHDF